MITALVIFIITYIFIGLRQIPRVHIDRPAGALVGAVLMIVFGVLTLDEAGAAASQQQPSSVTVISYVPHSVLRTFNVVLLCDTDEARAKGLQGFRPLGRNEAALFAFKDPEPVTFWMGSVAYPIDIIFIGPDKKVVRAYSDCKPGSRDLYPSSEPVKWVMETAAGSGIKVGDTVRIE